MFNVHGWLTTRTQNTPHLLGSAPGHYPGSLGSAGLGSSIVAPGLSGSEVGRTEGPVEAPSSSAFSSRSRATPAGDVSLSRSASSELGW